MLKKEKSLARPWGSASISAEKRQARESTPDADDERSTCTWWNQRDHQTNTAPDSTRNTVQTYHSNKMDSPLIRTWADQSTSRPPHNPVGAPRHTAEADTNITRSVPTAEQEDVLRVRPQRTPIRQKLRSAHCQQTAHCTSPARSTTPRPQHPTRRRPSPTCPPRPGLAVLHRAPPSSHRTRGTKRRTHTITHKQYRSW